MSDPLTVPANESGTVRLFALNMPPQQARFLREPGAADDVLGVGPLDPTQIEVFPLSDLQGVGLAGYLTEGFGIPAEQIAADRAKLDALKGHVMLVRSRAFGGRALTLQPKAGLDLIATYSEEPTNWSAAPIATDSARPRHGTPQSPRTARNRARRIGGSIFAVFMALIALILYLVLR